MSVIPAKIRASFEEIKKEYPFYVAIIPIKGRYYVYRRSSRWDRESRKIKSISEYLGKIEEDGTYIKKKVKSTAATTAPLSIKTGSEVSAKDMALLTILSMNANADLAHLGAKLLDLSPPETYRRVRALEQRYGIQYITEINVEKLGYLKFIGFIKFFDEVPSAEELRSAFEGDGRVELVLLTSGKYDVIFFFYAKSNSDVELFVNNARTSNPILRKYKAKWFVAPYYNEFGYIPLRDKFLDMIREQVETKSKEKTYRNIAQRDAIIMKELNTHANKNFAEIDEENKFGKGGADYSYHKLKKDGIIARTTITSTQLPIKFNAIIIIEIMDGIKYSQTRPPLLKDVIATCKSTGKYALMGDMEIPHSVILFLPVFSEEDLQITRQYLRSKIKGVKLRVLIVQKSVLGMFCYRSFDETYTIQYDVLVKERKLQAVKKIDYEETGRKHRIPKTAFRGEIEPEV